MWSWRRKLNKRGRYNNKKLIYTKTVIRGFQRVTVEEPSLLGGCAVWLENLFLKFPRNIPLTSSGLWVNSRTCNYEDGGGILLRNIGKPLPNHTAQKPTRPAFSNGNSFATTYHWNGNCGEHTTFAFSVCLSLSLTLSLSLSRKRAD